MSIIKDSSGTAITPSPNPMAALVKIAIDTINAIQNMCGSSKTRLMDERM
jgi:hypothetical protein